MRVTEREEILVAELDEFCKRQKLILDGMCYFGRTLKKIRKLERNDPLLVILENIEECRRCLRSFMITIYHPKPDKDAIFIEYNNVRLGEYPRYDSLTESDLIRMITLFYADFSMKLSSIGAVVASHDQDKDNKIFMPDGIDISETITKLFKIITTYCKHT